MTEYTRRSFLRTGTSLLALSQYGHADGEAPKPAAGAPPAAKKPPVDPYADAKFVDGPPPLPVNGAFTIVALPDTQNYRGPFSDGYSAQTKWIVEQQAARKISAVLHLGDITNNNLPEQWENAVKSMKLLDGKVPYFMVPGNHDYSKNGGSTDRTSLFSNYFPPASFKRLKTFGGFYDKEPERVENSYHFFDAAGRKFIVLCLEFGPRKDVVRWANEVMSKHHHLEAILVTHAFVFSDSTRYDLKKFGSKQTWNPHTYGLAKASNDDVTDGQELWDMLVSKHPNFIFTINGHVLNDGLGRLVTPAADGRDVSQMLVNFQMKPKGGDGWLRLIEMRPDQTMQVYDYSPTRNQTNASEQNQFEMKLAALAQA
jgi:3',5'-cyclic AMP phosphodiesterase CpdA